MNLFNLFLAFGNVWEAWEGSKTAEKINIAICVRGKSQFFRVSAIAMKLVSNGSEMKLTLNEITLSVGSWRNFKLNGRR